MNTPPTLIALWERFTATRLLCPFWFVWLITVVVLIAVLDEGWLHFDLWSNPSISDLLKDMVVFLASTIIAVGGVTITGFIFFIESIRRLVDSNQIYADTVDDMRERLLCAVIVTFSLCIVYAVICGICMVTVFDEVGGDDTRNAAASALLIIYGILLAENLHLDFRVMGYKSYLTNFARRNKTILRGRIEGAEKPYMRVLPEEFSSIPDTLVNRLKDEERKSLGESEQRSGYVVCLEGGDGYAVNTSVKNQKHAGTVVGYCRISDRYDIRDVMKAYDDTERILKRIAGLKDNSFKSEDYKRLESALGAKSVISSGNGMSDDIIDGYHILKKYHDSLVVAEDHRRRRDPITDRDLKAMMPFLSILRFELALKLSGKDLSGINLRGYDFTNAVMRNTILADGAYIDASFNGARMDCANVSRCDLSMSDLRDVSADSAVFDGSKMVRTELDGAVLRGSSFIGTSLRYASMARTDVTGCVLRGAEILSADVHGSDFSGSDLRSVNCVGTTAEDSRFANAIFDGSRMSDGTFRGCDFTGTNFGSSAINNMYFQKLVLNATRFEEADIMECIFVDSSFYDAYAARVNFTGSVLMGVNFSEARLSGCDFNKTVIGPYSRTGDGQETVYPDFRHATMASNTFTDSRIVGASFRFATLAGSRFSNVTLEDCDFTDCDMTGVTFVDCRFVGCEGLEETP